MRIEREGRPIQIETPVDRLYAEVPLAVELVFGRLPHIATLFVDDPFSDELGSYRNTEFRVFVAREEDAALAAWLASGGGAEAEAAALALSVLLHESIHALWPDRDTYGEDDGLTYVLSEGLTELTTHEFFDDFVAALATRMPMPGRHIDHPPSSSYPALVTACGVLVEGVCRLLHSETHAKLRELALWGFGTLDGAMAAMSDEIVQTLDLHPWSMLRRLRTDHAIVDAIREPFEALGVWDRSNGRAAGYDQSVRIGRFHGVAAVRRMDAVVAEVKAQHRA